MKRIEQDNKGLTLVELLVSMTVLSVVSLAIFSFMVFASKTYNKANGETNLQSEAQMTINRMENLIVSATNGVGADPTEPVDAAKKLYIYNHAAKEDGTVEYRIISIYQENNKLMYKYDTYGLDEFGSKVITTGSAPAVISDYIEDFSVNLTKLLSNQEVTVNLKMKNGQKTYETSNTFYMRNRIVQKVSSDADDYFKDEAEADKNNNVADVTITPESVYMWQGTSATPFSATIVTKDGSSPSGSILWRVSGNSDASTIIDANTGYLVIGKDETNDLTISATAVSTIGTGTGEVTARGRVFVKSVNSLDLTVDASNLQGNYISGSVVITGMNFQPETDLALLTPSVTCAGLGISVTRCDVAECSTENLKYSVRITQPDKPENPYTAVAVTTVPSSGNKYEDTETFSFPGGTNGFKLDSVRVFRTGVDTGKDVTNANVRIERGSSMNIYLNGTYKNETTGETREANLSIGTQKEEWTISNETELAAQGVTFMQETKEDAMTYRVTTEGPSSEKSQPDSVVVKMKWINSEDKEGGEVHVTLSFVDPDISINVPSNQNRFFLTQGKSEVMTVSVKGMQSGEYSAYIVSKDPSNSPISATCSGGQITFSCSVETQN
ncbi:MAG: prepilin-type N-terminal cleavage/methylation domain-containing protein, partial [Lachnospiraceae bacterium]|nr:prepilin-type N-terminal cleavage/methylation domain-containing protein [Lachnospiraceae bacterium]